MALSDLDNEFMSVKNIDKGEILLLHEWVSPGLMVFPAIFFSARPNVQHKDPL